VICEDRVTDGDVTSDTFIEAAICKDAERSSQMLLPVESLILQIVEFGVCPRLEDTAILGLATARNLLGCCSGCS
jgi:hypothetical protein